MKQTKVYSANVLIIFLDIIFLDILQAVKNKKNIFYMKFIGRKIMFSALR